MARTARILSELYDETFCNDTYEPFRITWSDSPPYQNNPIFT
jgi:hypothetical protein